MELNQIQSGNIQQQGKSMKSQSEGDQTERGNVEANSRQALLQTSTIFEGQTDQESFDQSYQSQPIQAQQVNKFSKGRYSQDQLSQQSKGESYRDTSSGQSSMDTYDAQTYEEAGPSTSQRASSPKEWFSIESEGFGKSSPIVDAYLKPASVVSKDKGMENSLTRKTAEEGAYWYSPPTPIQPSGVLDLPPPPLLGEVDTRKGYFIQLEAGKGGRKEDDLQPASLDPVDFCIGDIGLRSVGGEAKTAGTGTLRPKKRKKGKSQLGSSAKGSRENSKHCTELTENRGENRSHLESTGDLKENQSRSKTGTLRPKKGRLKVSAAGAREEDTIKRGMESAVITGDVLGERSNKISMHTKSNKLASEMDSEISKTNTLRLKMTTPELSSKGLKEAEKETNPEVDSVESARLDENNDILKISMDWRKGDFLSEDNLKASDMSILKPKTVKESRPDKNKTTHGNNLSENSENGSGEDIDILNSSRESEEKSLAHNHAKENNTVNAVAAEEQDIRTCNTDVNADDTDAKASAGTAVAMDTLLSISEVTAVTNWLEGEQGSGLEKALEQQPLPLPLLLPPPIVRVNKSVSGSCSDQAEIESTGAESEGDSCSAAWPPPPSPLRLRLRGWPEEEEERMQGNGSVADAGSQILAVHSLGLKLGLDPPSDPEDVEEGHNNDNKPVVRLPKEQFKEEDCEEESTGGPFEEMDMEICDPCYCYTKCWLDTFASFFCVSLL